MRQSTYAQASRTTRVLTRWKGMGAILAVAFYSLFFAAFQQLQNTPVYVRDGLLFGARTQTAFRTLTALRTEDHRGLGAEHPAFLLLHHPPVQLLMEGWQFLGKPHAQAGKLSLGMLTCLAGALIVVSVYHALLWSGVTALRSMLFAAACGGGTCLLAAAPVPEVWLFAGLGLAVTASVTARGAQAPWWLHGLTAVYAIACFVGNIIPVLLLTLARCAHDSAQQHRFIYRPLITSLAAITVAFDLANLQKLIYPMSDPLPRSLVTWTIQDAGWNSDRDTAGRVAREVFLSNLVAPRAVSTEPDTSFGNRRRVVLAEASWGHLDLQKGVAAGWFLLLALAFAGLVWRAQLDPFTLGMVSVIVWSLAALPWYGSTDRLLMLACLWTPAVVIATGLGLERSLEHWPQIRLPITLLLAAFVTAQITRNWMFVQEVVNQVKL